MRADPWCGSCGSPMRFDYLAGEWDHPSVAALMACKGPVPPGLYWPHDASQTSHRQLASPEWRKALHVAVALAYVNGSRKQSQLDRRAATRGLVEGRARRVEYRRQVAEATALA